MKHLSDWNELPDVPTSIYQDGLMKTFMCSIYIWSPFLQHTMMDHDNYTYLAITLSKQSRYFDNPSSITSTHPSLSYCGRVWELSDIHLISIPKDVWLRDGNDLMSQLIGSDGVLDVDVQTFRSWGRGTNDILKSCEASGWLASITIGDVDFRFVSRAVRTYRKQLHFRQWLGSRTWGLSLLPVGDDIPRGN